MDCASLLTDPTAKCVYWAIILLLLLVTVYHLWYQNERMGEFGKTLTDLDNHNRLSSGLEPTEGFRSHQRLALNVDPEEDKFIDILW